MERGATSYCHRGGETPLLGSTIPRHLQEMAGRNPQAEAAISSTRR